MPSERLPRLIRLLSQIQSNPTQGPDELAESLSVSRRTLFRDLRALADAGVPIVHEPGKGYRILESYFLPPLSLSVSEAVGVMLLGLQAEAAPAKPFSGPGLSAVRKLASMLPAPLRRGCAEMVASISYQPAAQVPGDRETPVHPTLQMAIDSRRVCRMRYHAALSEPMDVDLRPIRLHFVERAWYVYGQSDFSEGQVRAFKLSRIVEITATDETFEPPQFDLEDHVGLAWQMIPEGVEHDVSIVFNRMVARNVAEVRWHTTQQTEWLSDGRVRLRFRVDGVGEIAWWVCGYADQAEVEEPAELRSRVAAMLARAAERYNGSAETPT